MEPELRRWYVNTPSSAASVDAGVVGLTAAQLVPAAEQLGVVLGFQSAMHDAVPRATDRVDLHLPSYRGKSFIPVLAWLVATRLSRSGTTVVWHVDKQQGPSSVERLLGSLGWQLDETKQGRMRQLMGQPPEDADLPEPKQFTVEIGDAVVHLAADYGVFSPGEIDAGTGLLLEVAKRGPAVEVLADIGTGYGPLAIGLVRNGIAERAVATDVDCVALWLATCNAESNGVALDAVCSADPTAVEPTALTVCNIPTHIDAEQTAVLMARLLQRARDGRLLAVVHASLEGRYTRYLEQGGFSPVRHAGRAHVVLETGS